MMNTGQNSTGKMLKPPATQVCILPFFPGMKFIGKQDGRIMMVLKTEPLCAIKKDFWVMVHSVSVPVVPNAILPRNGQAFGERVVVTMPVNLRIVWSDKLVGLRIRLRSVFLHFIRIYGSGEIHQSQT